MSNRRIMTGYLVETKDEKGKVSHFGPFASENRAQNYLLCCPVEWEKKVIPLTIPHTLRVFVETHY
jgi:hypothetical protein